MGFGGNTFNQWGLIFDPIFSNWFFALILLVLAASLVLSWRGSRRLLSLSLRRRLLFLRTLAVALLALILARPALDLKKAEQIPGAIAVLIDASQSMDIKDQKKSRAEMVRESLEKAKDVFGQWNKEYQVAFYEFGEKLESSDWEHVIRAPAVPRFDQTDIGTTLTELQNLYANSDRVLSAVLLFSDGADRSFLEANLRANQSLPLIEKFPAPIYTFQPGEEKTFKDLAVSSLNYDDFGFVKTPFSIEVEIESDGFDIPSLSVTLREGREVIATKNIEVSGDGKPQKVEFRFSPKTLGTHVYTASIPIYEDEVVRTNNEKSFVVRIIRDKIRILHVAGHPSWDEKFMRLTLKGNPNIDLIAFYILRTRDDMLFDVSQEELSLIPFPVEDLFDPELDTFDLVIFQDFNYESFFPVSYLENLKKYVEKGGALMMLGGRGSFAGGGYARTPVADVLPLSMVETGASTHSYLDKNFKIALTDAGARHPITRLHADPSSNAALWRNLPGLSGVNLLGNVLPGGVVLAVGDGQPMLAVREVGKGRTMALATDSMWRWYFHRVRDGGTSEEYLTFVKNAIRWLVGDPAEALVDIEVAKNNLREGEKTQVIVRARDRSYQPNPKAKVHIDVLRGTDRDSVWQQEGVTDNAGRFTAEFSLKERGYYLLEAKVDLGGSWAEAETVVAVEGTQGEFARPRINGALLRYLADKTKGKYVVLPAKIDPRIHPRYDYHILNREIVPLWNRTLLLIIAIVLLALQWWERRRQGLA